MKIRTVLIEDELDALEHLTALLRDHCPNIELVGQAGDVVSGLKVIQNTDPELLITDIKLPDGTTFDILNQIHGISFNIIFVTAHSEYAIKAFKISAIDYLLKPVDIQELIAAIKKAEEEIQKQSVDERIKALLINVTQGGNFGKKIVLNINTELHVIYISDIIFCLSEGNFTHFYLQDGRKLTVTKNIKEYDDMLCEFNFFRASRQHLINLKHVISFTKGYAGTIKMVHGFEIPISVRRKDLFIELITTF